MNASAVLTERLGPLLVITLNRPARRNAVDEAMAQGISDALDLLDSDPELAVGVLCGAGGSFCSGLDLKASLEGERPVLADRGFAGIVERPPEKPLCAAVEGHAVAGGLEVMLACDLVVAAEDAKFGLPEVKRGLAAGGGGILHLSRRLPPAVALEIILTGDYFDAPRALELGLVTRLCPPGESLATAIELAGRIAGNAPLAVRRSKQLASEAAPIGAVQWERQRQVSMELLNSEDAKEGALSFARGEAPVWKGR